MYYTVLQRIAVVALIIQDVKAAETLNPNCVAGSQVTALPVCNGMISRNEACAGLPEKIDQRNCICKQDVIDEMAGCKNELRACFLKNDLDGSIDEDLKLWHSVCDTHITFRPTTAPPTPLSIKNEGDWCNAVVYPACISAQSLNKDCLEFAGNDIKWTSCACQPEFIRNEYTCSFLNNRTCFHTEAALTNLDSYSRCRNFDSVISSLPTETADLRPPGDFPSPGSTTGPAGPTSTSTAGLLADYQYVLSVAVLVVSALITALLLG